MSERAGPFYRRCLLSDGPATVAELHAAATAAGITSARSDSGVRSLLARDPTFVRRPDGLFDCAKCLLKGSVFTTRARYPTRGETEVWAGPELAAIDLLFVDGPLRLASGDIVSRSAHWESMWTGPKGWLPDVEVRQLLAFRWDGQVLDVSAVPDLESTHAGSEPAQRARQVLTHHLPHGRAGGTGPAGAGFAALARAVLRCLLDAPDVFSMELPPLDELLSADGGGPIPLASYEPADGRHSGAVGDRANLPPELTTVLLELQLPMALAEALTRQALLGRSLREYVEQLLAVEGWRRQSEATGEGGPVQR